MSATKALGANALTAVTTTQVSTANSTATTYAAAWYIAYTISSSPAAAATFLIRQSPDGTNYYDGQLYTCSQVNGTYYVGPIALDPDTQSTTVSFTAGTAGTCTFTAQLGTVTGV